MDKKTKEMLALAASYAVNCHPCLDYHKQKAIEAGMTEEEMRQAIKVGEMVRNGAHKITKEKAAALFGIADEKNCSQRSAESCCNH